MIVEVCTFILCRQPPGMHDNTSVLTKRSKIQPISPKDVTLTPSRKPLRDSKGKTSMYGGKGILMIALW